MLSELTHQLAMIHVYPANRFFYGECQRTRLDNLLSRKRYPKEREGSHPSYQCFDLIAIFERLDWVFVHTSPFKPVD